MASGFPSNATVRVKERMDRETVRFTLEWAIDKFKTLRKKSDYRWCVGITMRELGQDALTGRWRVGVVPCVKKIEAGIEKCYVGAYLILTDANVESVIYTSKKSVDAEFVIRACTGNDAAEISSSQLEHTFSRKEQTGVSNWGSSKLVSHDQLFGTDATPGLLKDDCLTIIIDVLMYGEPKAVNVPKLLTSDSPMRYKQFARRQAETLASNPHLPPTDFEIRSNDGQVFPTYRLLLMSHSPVFAAMLSHNCKENHLSRCELEDIDGESVSVMIDYVSGCDTEKVNVRNAEKVLIMTDKFELWDLRTVCEGILVQNVTEKNAVRYLILASQRKLDKLKEAAISMIPKNVEMLRNGALVKVFQADPQLRHTIVKHCSKKGAQ